MTDDDGNYQLLFVPEGVYDLIVRAAGQEITIENVEVRKREVTDVGITSVVCCEPSDEVCDGLDNDCDDAVDEGFDVGSSCSEGVGACQSSGAIACTPDGGSACDVSPGAPSAEICDGLDNDCNGDVDDGNPGGGGACSTGQPGVCSSGVQECTDGALTCVQTVQASAEICDDLDNDCDGEIDEDFSLGEACSVGLGECQNSGVVACTRGGAAACNAQPSMPRGEVCDGLDNDCDADVDEGFNVGSACSVGVGACSRAGALACTPEGDSACNVSPGAPSVEICDGVDNNCDGAVDEGNPGGGGACSTGLLGVCSAGVQACTDGALTCVQTVQPSPVESCDGLDNDCDGTVDEDIVALTRCGDGECRAFGTISCVNGAIVDSCTPGTPAPDDTVCDGLDNDCDGSVDEDFPSFLTVCGIGDCMASGSTSCVDGVIVDSCTPGTPSTETCDGRDNDCDLSVDEGGVCSGPSCDGPGEELCNDICVNLSNDISNCGACGNSCPMFQGCVNGSCQAPCSLGTQRCPDGVCRLVCPVSCDPGETACGSVCCEAGQTCIAGLFCG